MVTEVPAVAFISLSNMQAGGSVVRMLNAQNMGTMPFTYTVTTSGGTTALFTDPNGLQLRLRRGAAVIYEGRLAVTNLSFGITLRPGEGDLIEYTVYLPAAAGNAFQNLNETITFTWTATETT